MFYVPYIVSNSLEYICYILRVYLHFLSKKKALFVDFQNEAWKAVRKFYHFVCFLGSLWLQSHVENFLRMLWWCSGYLKHASGWELFSALSIKVISRVKKVVDPQFWFSGKNAHLSWLLILTFLSELTTQASMLGVSFLFGTIQAMGSHQPSVLEEDGAFFNNAKQDSETTTFQAAVRCCVTATLAA